jgi:hypothetical protein
MLYVVAWLCAWVVLFGGLGLYVALQCGRAALEGVLLGALLGPVGVFLVAVLPRGRCSGVDPPRRATDERAVSDFLGKL